MGYHIQIEKANLVIKAEVQKQVLAIWKDLNSPKYDNQKRGGGDGKKWYSWMSEDYDKKCSTIDDVLEELRFDIQRMPNNDVKIVGFESKMGQEDVFFKAISHLIEPEQYLLWKGEDGSPFAWSFDGKKILNVDPDKLPPSTNKQTNKDESLQSSNSKPELIAPPKKTKRYQL